MIIPVRLYKIKRILSEQRALFISFSVFILLSVVVCIFYARFNNQKQEVDTMNREVQALKSRFDILKYNTSLTMDQVKEYNKLLASLVPETEDFFSIIYALEEIGDASQFVITDYTIVVGKTTSERLVLSVQGSGDSDSFLKFLQVYQFAGGRLVTIDNIQYGGAGGGNTQVTLNFYNRRFTLDEAAKVPQLTNEEISKLDAIKQKIKFQLTPSENQSVSTVYKTKEDPFSVGTSESVTPTPTSASE